MKDRRTRTQHVLIQCRWSELSDDIMLLSNFIMNVLPNILKPSTMLLELLVQVNKLKVVCRWTGCIKSWWCFVFFGTNLAQNDRKSSLYPLFSRDVSARVLVVYTMSATRYKCGVYTGIIT